MLGKLQARTRPEGTTAVGRLRASVCSRCGKLFSANHRHLGDSLECESDKKIWRRGWDLNPRYPLRYVRFRGGSFQPLTHLSASDELKSYRAFP